MREKKQMKKGKDSTLLWASLICVALCLTVLSIFLLGDPMAAWNQKHEALSVFSADEIRMVASDPLGDGQELFRGVTVMLEPHQIDAVKEDLEWALQKSRFLERRVEITGVWLPSVTVASREEQTRIYLGENTLCLEKDGKCTVYEIREENLEQYRGLYGTISSYLDEARR